MRKHLIPLIFFLICGNLHSQQIPLEGVVTVQNSRVNTGKTEYVSDASITHPKAKPTSTDSDGKFRLHITGVGSGTQIGIQVTPMGKYKDFVVVNEREIQDITLGRSLPVQIYICNKAELDRRKAELIGINMKKQDEMRARKIKELNKRIARLEQENAYASEEYQKTIDSLKVITDDRADALSRIKEYVERMIVINLDRADSVYLNAYRMFEQGELDSVSRYLDQHLDYEKKRAAIQKLESDARDEKELAEQLTTNAEQKFAKAEQERKSLVETLLLNARSKASLYLYSDAIDAYENNGIRHPECRISF